jgi:diguanylate cyclase (GGDEF)-like protein
LSSNRTNDTDFEKYILDNFDKALSEEWIKAYHQPLVRASSGLVSDEEAFARWEDPKHGLISASEFVPILEKANLTYKLDLYMVERVLNKLKGQAEHGLFIVPESINLSRSDFDCCDMVKEIVKRIDDSGLPRDILSVELSERDISSDIDFMLEQVKSFHREGIKVWMDDYGSGYSSLLILLKVRFDLLKIDKIFIDQIEKSESGRIILTELIKTAVSLGMDTVSEGVETQAQVDFLQEVGCNKLQGYYYIHPISLAQILERNRTGTQIGFENPKEADYYEQLGRVNLYDLSLTAQDDKALGNYFDTMPMVIFSLSDTKATFIRCNKSYRQFTQENHFNIDKNRTYEFDKIPKGVGYYSFNSVKKCAETGQRLIIDDRLADGRTLQLLIRRICVNPVTHEAAVAIAILSVSEINSSDALTYNYIARALSEDYIDLYFVNMDTEEYTRFSSNGEINDISFSDKGEYFFDIERPEMRQYLIEDDKKQLQADFTKEKIAAGLANNDTYSIITRLMLDGKPNFVSIKFVKVKGDGNFVIAGITNIDEQLKTREALERAKEEKIIYSRIGALTGDYIYIYTIDPHTMAYSKYTPSGIVSDLGLPDHGDDFFEDVISKAEIGIFHEDLDFFLTEFTKDNLLNQIEKKGMFENYHRLNFRGEPLYVVLRATMVKEDDETKLIVGILNIDEKVKREQEYAQNLFAAENKASLDEMTGVKNKRSYSETESKLDALIDQKNVPPFAIAVFDINGLKQINDTLGHQAGDDYIKKGCDTVCRFFKHSPVFRVGGDEFAVIVQGYDFLNIDAIISKFKKHIIKNKLKGDVVIAVGVSIYSNDKRVSDVFKRADSEMYQNKRELKQMDV